MLVFDAAGLAVFAVSGALKALAFGLNPARGGAAGMLTGIGGGMVRDVLVAEVPTVLRAELYAVAALAGAAVVVGGDLLGLPSCRRDRGRRCVLRAAARRASTWLAASGRAGQSTNHSSRHSFVSGTGRHRRHVRTLSRSWLG